MKLFECLYNLTILTSFCVVVMRFCIIEKKQSLNLFHHRYFCLHNHLWTKSFVVPRMIVPQSHVFLSSVKIVFPKIFLSLIWSLITAVCFFYSFLVSQLNIEKNQCLVFFSGWCNFLSVIVQASNLKLVVVFYSGLQLFS